MVELLDEPRGAFRHPEDVHHAAVGLEAGVQLDERHRVRRVRDGAGFWVDACEYPATAEVVVAVRKAGGTVVIGVNAHTVSASPHIPGSSYGVAGKQAGFRGFFNSILCANPLALHTPVR